MGTYYDTPWIMGSHIFSQRQDREDKVAALKRGIDLGINLIDTAEMYNTEPLVAEAIQGYDRDTLFVATKVWITHLKYDQVLKAAQRSLAKLQCSYIDLYQIHWQNPMVPVKETLKAMEKLVDEGRVRYIGVSNFSLSRMREAQEALSKYELASNQMEYSLKVKTIEADLTPAQIALNWLVNKSKVVFPIPRASQPQRVMENANALGWSLDQEDFDKLDQST